jgi:serine phosphatase RsbU (regulator of sigma subunit)
MTVAKFSLFFSVFTFLFAIFQGGYAQVLLPFTDNDLSQTEKVSPNRKQHQILADTNGVFTFQNILTTHKSKFVNNDTKLLGFSPQVKVWWLRFSLKNTDTTNLKTFYLLTDDNNWASTEFYIADTTLTDSFKWHKEIGGWLIPDSLCHTDRISEALPLTLKAGEEKEIYIRKTVAYISPYQDRGVTQNIGSEEFNKILTNDLLFVFLIEAIFLGVILMMTFYNFALFVAMKEWGYFWYVWLILSFGLSFSEEALYEIVAEGGLFYYQFLDFLNAIAIIFSVLFAATFLKARRNFPVWFWVLCFTTLIPIATIIIILGHDFITPTFRQEFLETAFIPNTILHIVALLGLGMRGSQRQDTRATLFLAAGALLLFSLVVWNIHLLLVGEIRTTSLFGFVIYFSPKISFCIMAVLFSRHLTLRINALRKALLHEQLDKEVERKRIIEQQNTILEELVQVRTAEIEQQKEEISTQRDALELQNERITKQHEDITASINAAQRIQKAMLQRPAEIVKALPQHFILFRPRDIVSGDFYYFYSNIAENNLENNVFFTVLAAVDCTGHGVPGAFMSMVGNELLNEIVQTHHIHDANEILDALNAGVKRALQQEETANRDGMDIALCVIKKSAFISTEITVEYAGANNPLYYVSPSLSEEKLDYQFHEIKANKMPIGGLQYENKPFTKHTIQITDKIFIGENTETTTLFAHQNSTFYLLSDGYQDQFGGEKGKKFMVKKLKELLLQIAHLPIDEQKRVLEQTLDTWKNGYPQVDDILVFGFKVC